MKTQIINKTPHPIHIIDEQGKVIRTFESQGQIRLNTETKPAGEIENIPLTKTVYGEAEGLSESEYYTEEDDVYMKYIDDPKIYYIVSQLVKNALPERNDLLVPAEVVRDNKGNIVGCKSLGI